MSASAATLLESRFPGMGEPKRGKVRDIYDFGAHLLLVASDRISAFDVVLPNGLPEKGVLLTQLSRFWLEWIGQRGVAHHLITTDVNRFPLACRPHRALLQGRSMWVKKSRPLPVECIVRGYLSGSGWAEYQKNGMICGESLPPGLQESDRLPVPIFTPSTKAETGQHDVGISFNQMESLIGSDWAGKVRALSLSIYTQAAAWAEPRGILIADTKMEFGLDLETGQLLLIDELLTPDSSRFWPMESYHPGQPQTSFDKQFVRDYLRAIAWDGTPPAPHLPDEILQKTREKYVEAIERLTR
jgi:phosphoribosylaminoimidazole-succinocarboxamide synthase